MWPSWSRPCRPKYRDPPTHAAQSRWARVRDHGGHLCSSVDCGTEGYTDIWAETESVNQALIGAAQAVIARHGPFDLIHNHDWLTAQAAWTLKHAHKLPLVATIHATERGRGRGTLWGALPNLINDTEWRLTYEAWRVICCTRYMEQEIVDYFQAPAEKLDIIPNGVDPRPFEALDKEDLSAFRTRYAQPYEELVFSVGRIVAEKGIETLIRSAAIVAQKRPNCKFVIAGKGPELDAMRQLVNTLGLTQTVIMAGFISDDDRNRLYKVADCAVFPSLYEPFGIVALEGMAAHTPVVVSEVGGLREVVEHAQTGITVYPGDPASCAWGILHTLEHPDWAALRVANAIKAVHTTFDWQTIAKQTTQVYERVIQERSLSDW